MNLLQPRDRATLLDSLRPPTGFTFDAAVATTYSLHLEALLTAPLAFALYDSISESDIDPETGLEPIAVLEAVRRYAGRMAVFCQSGQIAVPPSRPVLAWLEDVVIPVAAPREGAVFHPKVWVVRFVRESDGSRALRLLCLSRNLTFDRSWDTLLRLDSHVLGSQLGDPDIDTGPLQRFVDALPSLAVGPMPPTRVDLVESMVADLGRCHFALPDGSTAGRFWPLGIGDEAGDPLPNGRQRTLTISPFVTKRRLLAVAGQGGGHVLVSRPDELDRLAVGALDHFDEVFTLTPDADLGSVTTARGPDAEVDSVEVDREEVQHDDEPGCSLSGLHAKVTVAETSKGTVLLTGSANATTAAFGHNVEFVTELSVTALRIADLLEPVPGEPSLGNLLVPYSPPDRPVVPNEAEQLVDELDRVRRQVASVAFEGRVSSDDESGFVIRLRTSGPVLGPDAPPQLTARAWPVTMSDTHAASAPLGGSLDLAFPCSLEGLTSFFAIELVLERGGERADTRFVVSAPLQGVPENRHTRIIAAILRDRDRFVRYLLLLLGNPGEAEQLAGEAAAWLGRGSFGAEGHEDIPLLEVLVRSLARSPGRLDHVASLIDELTATEDGRKVLPDGFERVWTPIWAARRAITDA